MFFFFPLFLNLAQVVVPAGNVSVSFEVQAKGVGQVTAYLSSNNTHIKRCVAHPNLSLIK